MAAIVELVPAANSHQAPIATDVAAVFDAEINSATATRHTFVVHGQQGGQPVTANILTEGATVTLDPAANFFPAESVQVTATSGMRSTAGDPVDPHVWQFPHVRQRRDQPVHTFTATLSEVTTAPVTIDLALSGTATADSDYITSGNQIVIAPGSASGSVTVTALDDEEDEGNEAVVGCRQGERRIRYDPFKLEITGATVGADTPVGEELLRQHPDLKPEEVYAALTYFYDHFEQMAERIRSEAGESESLGGASHLARAELLARQAAWKEQPESS